MDYSEKRNLILKGNMSKVILTLAIPIMLNNLVQTMYNLADTFWVSKIGKIEVAATTFVWPVLFLIISIGMGINVAGTALISQYIGAGNKKNGDMIAGQIFSFSMMFALVFAVCGYFCTPFIVSAMGAQGSLFTSSCKYLSIMFFDIPFLFITYIFTAIKQAQGDTLAPMIINVSGAVLNIILDPVFIFNFNLGIGGAAAATVLSKAVFTFYILHALFKSQEGVRLTLKNLKPNKKLILKILKIGLPASIGQSGEALGFIILNIFIAAYGNSTLAAFGIGNKINSVIMMPALGIGSALSAIAGQNIGANQIGRVQEAFKTSIKLSLIMLIAGGTVMLILSHDVIRAFTLDKEVLKEGTYYLKLISAAVPLMGIFQVCLGIFEGSGHTFYCMVMEMTRLWGIRLPMIVLLQKFTDIGSSAVWYSMISSNAIICVIGVLIYLSGKWQKKDITSAVQKE